MSTDPQYSAAHIEADVNVTAIRRFDDENNSFAKREVTLKFQETFFDDAELDAALEAFTKTVKEAARR